MSTDLAHVSAAASCALDALAPDDPLAAEPGAREALAEALKRLPFLLLQRLLDPEDSRDGPCAVDIDPRDRRIKEAILRLPVGTRLAREELAAQFHETAVEAARQGKARAANGCGGPLFYIALALWTLHVRARVERLATECPTVPLTFMDAATGGYFSKGRVARGTDVLDRAGRVVATVRQPAVPAMAIQPELLDPRALGAGESLHAQRLFRWLARRAWEQWHLEARDPRVIHVPGGLAGLAQALGLGRSGSARNVLHRALDLFQYVHLKNGADEHHGLLTWEHVRTRRPGGPESIRITVGTLLMPTAHRGLLVPVPERLPPLATNPHRQGREACLQLRVLVEFRQHAEELLPDAAGVLISADRWRDLFDAVGLDPSDVKPVLERWTRGNGEEDPFLVQLDEEHWTLAPSYRKELEFLRESGAITLWGREGGWKRVARRRQATASDRITGAGVQRRADRDFRDS